MRTEANTSQLQSKIVSGLPSFNGEYKYMASLQLDGKHICSSGIIQEGFLLTTGECAWHIKDGMDFEKKKGTAVLGSSNLEEGQKIDIIKIAVNVRFLSGAPFTINKPYDFGIIMVCQYKIFDSMIE